MRGKHCDGIEGIIEEGKSIMEEDFDDATMDACLIAAGQRAEHYEMAAYGTLVAWARGMGHTEAAELLQQNLDEEKAADKKLSELAEGGINRSAADAAHSEEEEELVGAGAGTKRRARRNQSRTVAANAHITLVSALRDSGRAAATAARPRDPPGLVCRRTAAKADDVAVGILDVEVLRAPRGRRERLQNRCAVGDALPEEGFDAVHAGCSVEVLVVAPVSTLVLVLRRFLQVQFQSVQMADGVEAIPRLAEREAELLGSTRSSARGRRRGTAERRM